MPAGTYDQFPGIDSENNFAPEVRAAFLNSTDVKAAVDARATTVANAKVAAATAVRQYQNYRWADQAARLAQTGMRKFDRGVQVDNGQEWQYDGAAWQTYLFAKSALTDIQTLDIPGNYRAASLTALFYLMNDDSKRPAPGSLIHVGYSLTAGSTGTEYHFGSVWRVTPGGQTAEPLPGSPILLDGTGSLATVARLCKSGGDWNSRMTLDHNVSSAQLAGVGAQSFRREYVWSAQSNANGQPQWRLKASNTSYSVFSYRGATDQFMTNGQWTVPQFDTTEFDGLFMDYQGTSPGNPRSSYQVVNEGRYEFMFRWAPTNTDATPYLSTIYNESLGGDTYTTHMGVVADWGVLHMGSRWFYAGNTIRAAVYKSSGTNNWFRRGDPSSNVNFDSNRPFLMVRYVGPF